MDTAKREMSFLLAQPERRLLRNMAVKLPRSIRPNHLTALGVLGAAGIGSAYALSMYHEAWLWVASVMLVVNWLGDSLDGTLARVRRVERPRYGYYIDHIVDAFNTAVIGVGIGLSPYVSLELALVLVVIYLTLSINVYLESTVFGVFKIAYGKIGPTEARIMLILANIALVLGPTLLGALEASVRLFSNTVVALVAVSMFAVLTVRFGKNLHRLARLEPQEFRRQ